jgi:hypothetical protein
MPLNLAVFAPQRAASVIEAFPRLARCAVGGQSLGGTMAARFVHGRPASAEQLVLWAAYPADNGDLAGQDLAVALIYGTPDGVATVEEINASRPLLPKVATMHNSAGAARRAVAVRSVLGRFRRLLRTSRRTGPSLEDE